jgi:hypothetical protein
MCGYVYVLSFIDSSKNKSKQIWQLAVLSSVKCTLLLSRLIVIIVIDVFEFNDILYIMKNDSY